MKFRPSDVVPQPLTVQAVPPGKTVPCAGSGSAPTALLNTNGVAKYKSATSFNIDSDE